MTNNNHTMKNNGIIEQIRAFGEDLADQEDWREADNKAVVLLAVDAEANSACTVGLGNEYIMEIMLYGFLTQEQNKELRHRLTKALAIKMAQELDADKQGASLATRIQPATLSVSPSCYSIISNDNEDIHQRTDNRARH